MTGSVQIKNDKFYAVLNFRNQEGKRIQKWIPLNLPVKGNRRKADAMLNQLLIDYQGIESVEPMNTLLSQHIAAWIESNRPNIAVTTYDQYVNMLRLHIGPYFDQKKITLNKVTAGDLEDYYTAKAAEGLSPNTIIKHHAVIRSALQWAVKHRYIRENVADLANKPDHIKYQGAAPYSVEEIGNLLYLTQNEPIAVPIFLASFYGLRRSEMLGLRWSAIDFQTGWIHIDTTVVREKQGDHIQTVIRENTTKTASSKRSLPLCHQTYQYFWTLQQKQRAQWAMYGDSYDTRYVDFVCVNDMGTLLQPDYISQKFHKVLKKYGLRMIRYHDLRHSCATIMLYLGYTMKDIQTWLGHSNYNFTADTYVHSAPDSHLQMASALAENIPMLQGIDPILTDPNVTPIQNPLC